MLSRRHIFVGVDFSEAGVAAVREACRLAGSCSEDATAVHVLEPSGNLALQEGLAPYPVDIRATLREQAEAQWQELSATIGPLPRVHFAAPIGSPASTLLELSEPMTRALMVLGINSSEPFRPGAGVVAAQCVRYARSPVLLVAPQFAGPYRHVVLATDFSSTAAVACRWADDLTARDGAKLTALHVRSPRDAGQDSVEQRMAGFLADHAPALGRSARVAIASGQGDRGRAIADFAAAEGADLIVMGRRGHSPLRHLFVGSTAERVLKHAAINLLLLSPTSG